MQKIRDYDREISDTLYHQYAYGFDFDVMHPYMIKSFKPFFLPGSFLELGCFKGDFTRRFLEIYEDVTCIILFLNKDPGFCFVFLLLSLLRFFYFSDLFYFRL